MVHRSAVQLTLHCAQSLCCVRLFATPWTVACQAPLSRGISRQEYWSGLPCPPLEDFPNPGIQPRSPVLQMDSLSAELPGKPPTHFYVLIIPLDPAITCSPQARRLRITFKYFFFFFFFLSLFCLF